MIVSVHQPQYLPWLGYFDKIDRSDVFVFLDNVQYKKREFQNRNRIKTPDGDIWLTVPVQTKSNPHQKICHVQIDNTTNWQQKHWRSIERNYRRSPYFPSDGVELQSLYQSPWTHLNLLNQSCVACIMKLLRISTPVILESDLGVMTTRTERIINICQKVGGTVYLSGAGGHDYLDAHQITDVGIELRYQDYIHPTYSQLYGDFRPYMSVIDLLFNCGPNSLKILRRG